VVVNDDNLVEMLALFNADAKAISRRGYVGVHGAEYVKAHDLINALLDDMFREASPDQRA